MFRRHTRAPHVNSGKGSMKAIAINGSPRKTWNTATLLESALRGCAAGGAETELVHLYSHAYQGCTSCFRCKKIGGRSYGRCGMKDDLTPILERALEADVVLLGSPIYFHTETGEMRSFLERFIFPNLSYTPGHASIFPRKLPIGLVYTMNVTEAQMPAYNQDASVAASSRTLGRIFGSCEVLLCTDTYQF